MHLGQSGIPLASHQVSPSLRHLRQPSKPRHRTGPTCRGPRIPQNLPPCLSSGSAKLESKRRKRCLSGTAAESVGNQSTVRSSSIDLNPAARGFRGRCPTRETGSVPPMMPTNGSQVHLVLQFTCWVQAQRNPAGSHMLSSRLCRLPVSFLRQTTRLVRCLQEKVVLRASSSSASGPLRTLRTDPRQQPWLEQSRLDEVAGG